MRSLPFGLWLFFVVASTVLAADKPVGYYSLQALDFICAISHRDIVAEFDPQAGYKIVLPILGEYLISSEQFATVVNVTVDTGSLELVIPLAQAGDRVFVTEQGKATAKKNPKVYVFVFGSCSDQWCKAVYFR